MFEEKEHKAEGDEEISFRPRGEDDMAARNHLSKSLISNTVLQYDSNYTRQYVAVLAGLILIIISFFIISQGIDELGIYERAIYGMLLIFIRVIAVVWVIKLANMQNRNPTLWSVIAVFLPAISLISLGLTRKKLIIPEIVDGLSKNENIKLLLTKSELYFDKEKFAESLVFAEKAELLDSNNIAVKNMLIKIRQTIPVKAIVNQDFQTVYRKVKNDILLKIVCRNHEINGAEVYINDVVAPDDDYLYDKDKVKIVVRNGRIKNVVTVSHGLPAMI